MDDAPADQARPEQQVQQAPEQALQAAGHLVTDTLAFNIGCSPSGFLSWDVLA